MKRSNQLVLESAVIASVLIMLTLGGSVATTAIPPSFIPLQDPGLVKAAHDSSALAGYYNSTLTQIGVGNFANASFFIDTFHFVNIAPAVNATALAANSDLAIVNSTSANATTIFKLAEAAISAKEYVNATILVNEGCALAQQANISLADFLGPQTSHFKSESIPVSQYAKGSASASSEVKQLLDTCNALRRLVMFTGLTLLIGSPQTTIETGGTLELTGNLTFRGAPVVGDKVLFYINGTYFGSLTTGSGGELTGTLRIQYIYTRFASVQALALPNSTLGIAGATSNVLIFEILFDQTSIVVGDPPAVLPTFSFNVQGNLTTVTGSPLPGAPVNVTFFGSSQIVRTDSAGIFATRLTVPANATDGVYDVYAAFAPSGVFGPSVNFTSIQVIHLPMHLTLSAPSLSLAGLSETLTGTASSNGTALADANITLDTPWGTATARTDFAGDFRLNLQVSPLEFAFSKNITVTAVAEQPYVAQGAVVKTLGLFNFLLVVLPVAAVGIVGYEADRLGVFDAIRRSKKGETALLEEPLGGSEASLLERSAEGIELLRLYRRSVALASKKYSVRLRPSMTIREILAAVRSKEQGGAAAPFSELLLTVEDFLYAPSFDPGRIDSARAEASQLEEAWR